MAMFLPLLVAVWWACPAQAGPINLDLLNFFELQLIQSQFECRDGFSLNSLNRRKLNRFVAQFKEVLVEECNIQACGIKLDTRFDLDVSGSQFEVDLTDGNLETLIATCLSYKEVELMGCNVAAIEASTMSTTTSTSTTSTTTTTTSTTSTSTTYLDACLEAAHVQEASFEGYRQARGSRIVHANDRVWAGAWDSSAMIVPWGFFTPELGRRGDGEHAMVLFGMEADVSQTTRLQWTGGVTYEVSLALGLGSGYYDNELTFGLRDGEGNVVVSRTVSSANMSSSSFVTGNRQRERLHLKCGDLDDLDLDDIHNVDIHNINIHNINIHNVDIHNIDVHHSDADDGFDIDPNNASYHNHHHLDHFYNN
ncbi:uncharacterized protein MONBRDRAFT_11129 [Monosiga brevicollis MX1]|uniref:Galectin n=1 Tax=Monosiga brevicollis TaxID=81824 RepID=A9V8A4_MONBE|nr:uncharacterized protein MONBRDRAFT_11129 [Monosiga brevicollis MX1]EDQ86305.1 predicted protein [Monosiga brevicollis MX1]|eukprot:XP_001748975.1 hypothetical protein [Monosiga brevicollis MX1]